MARCCWRVLLAVCCIGSGLAVADSDKRYQLKPIAVAADTYAVVGVNEDFTFQNGGNIVNTGFIVTSAGVVVIDTGPSLGYGRELRAVIGRITDKPVLRVYLTHMHPDHFLGNQAFHDVPVLALADTVAGMRNFAETFTDNMYRLVGAWMEGTGVALPTATVVPGTVEIGGHRIRLIASAGHTDADLVILDETTGVLFAGDLVFHQRAATTPHADIARWLQSLDELARLQFQVLVPGHGPISRTDAAIVQTRRYLSWLDDTLTAAAGNGADMAEVLFTVLPVEFRALAVLPDEFHRSISHLYPAREQQALPASAAP